MIDLTPTPTGLEITLTDKEEFLEYYEDEKENPNMYITIHDLLDDSRHLGNGWSSGEGKFALTEAPIILQEEETDDEGQYVNAEGIYFFERYMIENPFQTLLDTGKVTFNRA